MSLRWAIRLGLLAALFVVVGITRRVLPDRQRYGRILESKFFAALGVVTFTACCLLSVGLPEDPRVIPTPPILEEALVAARLHVVGNVLLLFGGGWCLLTVLRRRVIGAQDTKEGLITSGVYRFSRHPIYLGIILMSLAFPLLDANIDGVLAFPVVFLANRWLADVEERYDVGLRFRAEYAAYRSRTAMFAPLWFWLVLVGVVASIVVAGLSV